MEVLVTFWNCLRDLNEKNELIPRRNEEAVSPAHGTAVSNELEKNRLSRVAKESDKVHHLSWPVNRGHNLRMKCSRCLRDVEQKRGRISLINLTVDTGQEDTVEQYRIQMKHTHNTIFGWNPFTFSIYKNHKYNNNHVIYLLRALHSLPHAPSCLLVRVLNFPPNGPVHFGPGSLTLWTPLDIPWEKHINTIFITSFSCSFEDCGGFFWEYKRDFGFIYFITKVLGSDENLWALNNEHQVVMSCYSTRG